MVTVFILLLRRKANPLTLLLHIQSKLSDFSSSLVFWLVMMLIATELAFQLMVKNEILPEEREKSDSQTQL